MLGAKPLPVNRSSNALPKPLTPRNLVEFCPASRAPGRSSGRAPRLRFQSPPIAARAIYPSTRLSIKSAPRASHLPLSAFYQASNGDMGVLYEARMVPGAHPRYYWLFRRKGGPTCQVCWRLRPPSPTRSRGRLVPPAPRREKVPKRRGGARSWLPPGRDL
jgi:hypothetical protein